MIDTHTVRRNFVAFSVCVALCQSLGHAEDQLKAPEPAPVAASTLNVERGLHETTIVLKGRDARRQLVVTRLTGNSTADVTHSAKYRVVPESFVRVDSTGLLTPIADGTCQVICQDGEAETSATVTVTGFNANQPVSFPSQVVPLFTKFGCNGGGCHGKSGGQNGFRLSLLGFEPREDYEYLLKESRGRRLFPAAPDQSLLLTKAINLAPHGGGQRFQQDSHEYRLLRRWIAQGMPYSNGEEATLDRIEIIPPARQVAVGSKQQLAVLAHYSDGSSEDITRATQFEPNAVEMAEVSPEGLVKFQDLVGDVAIMARYQGQVGVFSAAIPLGATVADLPTPRNVVDVAVFNKLKTLGLPPSKPCDDATFIRRATLDIAGRLPTPEETEQYVAGTNPDKQSQLIDRLLDSNDYADYFANKWSAILRNRRAKAEYQLGNFTFHQWIRQSLLQNKPYDQFVREIVTASGSVASNPPTAWLREVSDTNQRVEDAAQLFLGQRIQCARCHHHPFEKWSQRDYYQLSAFFTLVSKKDGPTPDEPVFFSRAGSPTAPHPKSGEALKPAGLSANVIDIPVTVDPRVALADWMVEAKNPFFAKSLVNRYWKHFFGLGLVEPEDDMRVTNPPSNAELLDGLAAAFVESGYDLKALIRLICNSHVYSLGSEANEMNLNDRRSYSRFYPKRLTAEVLLDAVDRVLGVSTEFAGVPRGTRAISLPDASFNSYFLTVFGRPDSTTACECERSQESNLAQSLHLLNSKEIQGKLTNNEGHAAKFAAQAEVPPAEKVARLYLTALSRSPTAEESKIAVDYLQSKSLTREAYEDLIWSLVNSKEFLFNH